MSAGPTAPSADTTAASLRERSLRLPRQVYRLRTLGLVVGAFAVAAVFYENRAPWLAWALLIFHVGLWPHLAWFRARRSADPHVAERVNLTVDSAFGGVYIALMHFNLLPSVLIAAMKSMDKIGWGPQFLARTTAAMAAACAATMIFTRAAFQPHTSMSVVVASLPLLVAYPIAVAFTSYRSGRLARERNKAIEQTAALREQLTHIARVGTLGEMAAGLAHELNQPLAAIHFEASAALEVPQEASADGMRQALTAIAEQSLRAGDIVRRMRVFARRGQPARELSDVRQLVREVLALLSHELRLHGVETSEAFDEVPAVLVDRVELQQVLVNLIRHAMEAMTTTPAGERHLSIEAHAANRHVRVSVADSGEGVDPAIAATLFHPFQSTKPSGLGLGLSICQSLIEAHGGRIGTIPRAGRGAVFYFELPAVQGIPPS